MTTTRQLGLAASGVAALVVTGFMAPGAYASGAVVDDDITVSNAETVQVLMDATGKINTQRVYDQLVLTGSGSVDLANPVSTKGLRNLDGFGNFEVRGGAVHIMSDVSGTKKFRSVSDFTEKLPLKLDVAYTLNGKTVEPGDVVGKRGTLEVRYRVTNTTGIQKDVVFDDGLGAQKLSRETVVVPMVGSLTTTLPSNFTKVSSAEANAAGDGRGATKLSFTMTLIPPIGKDTASFGYTAQIKDGVIPKASLSALPVDPLQSPSFKGGAASYEGGAETGQDLTAGATEIDANVLKLRDGAQDLVAGLILLNEGGAKLNNGLSGEAAPGARKLSSGAGELDAGAEKLADGTGDLRAGAGRLDAGAGKLADGLDEAKSKAPALIDGLSQIEAGLQALDAGLGVFKGQVVPGLDAINNGAIAILAGLGERLIPGLTGVENALTQALALVGSLDDALPQKGQLTAAITGAKDGVSQVKGGLSSQVRPGAVQIRDGSAALSAGVTSQTTNAGLAGTLKNGVAQLLAGMDQILTNAQPLVDGLGLLSDGADELSAGTGELRSGASKLDGGAGRLSDGTGKLSAGASDLADGLRTAADGSGQLADGLGEAAGKAPALPEGAERLSKEGTSKLVEAGDATAKDYGLKYALIAAGAERAGEAQPYGSPEGATALTAYTYELAAANGADTANLKRGLGALVVLAVCAGLAAMRRVRT